VRQDWLARWEEKGVQMEYRFTSLHYEAVAHTAFKLQLLQEKGEVPSAYQLERVGEPYRIALIEKPTHILKTLYCMVYNTETPEPTKKTVAHTIFFYGVDREEALRIAQEKKQEMEGPMWIEEVKAYPQGFTIVNTTMPGRVLFNPDGTVVQ
jgi:hypothetical protein